LITTVKRINQGQEPLIGTFKIAAHNPLVLDPDDFRTKFEDHVAEQVDRLHKAILRREYLGVRVSDPSQFIATLLAMKQLQADPSTGRFYFKSVNQYHTDFTQVLNTWDPSDPLPVDAVQIFWSGLKSDIHTKAQSTHYTIPSMAEGQQQEPFEDMMNRLRVVKEKAEQFSSEIKETFDIANRAIGRSAQRNPRTSFQAPVSLGAQATTFYPGAESFWPTPQSPYESSVSYAAHLTTQTIPPSYTLHHEALPLDKADEFTDCGEDYATYSFEPQYAARTTQPASPYESDVGLYL
jgi:hypothetical protein